MHLKEDYKVKHYLEKDELELLNSSNEYFKIYLSVELVVEREFDWDSDDLNWKWKSTADICIGIKEGYIKGKSKDIFAPNDNITRAEAISMLSRVKK